jgi:hypothetical protein
MKNAFIIMSLILLTLAGCGPKTGSGGEAHRGDSYNLQIDVNDGSMIVAWKRHTGGMISGYNIYISEEPLAARFPGPGIDPSIQPHNRTPFPGDTNPDDNMEYYTAESLENGLRYYVSVRIVFPDGTLSEPSREVTAVCGPRGEIDLAVRYQSDHDGYSFEQNEYVRADAVDNDLYFFSKDGIDHLASPIRLNGFLNDTRLLVLPYGGSLEEVSSRVMESKLTPTDDQVDISTGDWVLARTASGRHALLHVLALRGDGKERQIHLFFAYSALVGEVFF